MPGRRNFIRGSRWRRPCIRTPRRRPGATAASQSSTCSEAGKTADGERRWLAPGHLQRPRSTITGELRDDHHPATGHTFQIAHPILRCCSTGTSNGESPGFLARFGAVCSPSRLLRHAPAGPQSLARDPPSEIKPLYYHARKKDFLVFASEVKGICSAGGTGSGRGATGTPFAGFLMTGAVPAAAHHCQRNPLSSLRVTGAEMERRASLEPPSILGSCVVLPPHRTAPTPLEFAQLVLEGHGYEGI